MAESCEIMQVIKASWTISQKQKIWVLFSKSTKTEGKTAHDFGVFYDMCMGSTTWKETRIIQYGNKTKKSNFAVYYYYAWDTSLSEKKYVTYWEMSLYLSPDVKSL